MACAVLLAGLPPLSGFLAKFAILAPLFGGAEGGLPPTTWVLLAALILSGLASVVAMLRVGIEVFWTSPAETPPRVRVIEIAPVALLLVLCGALTIGAGPAMEYMYATAQALHMPQGYLGSVLAVQGGG
jgi:multicomponent K+:H+ antiporter subunit D